jgi:hypothetical protein
MHVYTSVVVWTLLVCAFSSASAPVAAPELKKLFHRYEGLNELSVDFEQTKLLKDVPTPLISKGHLNVKTPNEVVWTIRSPAFLEVKMKGGDVQITSGTGAGADVQKISKAQMAANPQSRSLEGLTHWLQFDATYLNQEYAVEKISNTQYSFKPRASDSPFKEMKVELGSEDVVKGVELLETSGDKLILHFQKPSIKRAAK